MAIDGVEYRAGQRWAFQPGPPAFSRSFQILTADDDFAILVLFRADLRDRYGIESLRVRVTEAVLDRSVTEFIAEESELPEWAGEDYYERDERPPFSEPLNGVQLYGDLAKIIARVWRRMNRIDWAIDNRLVALLSDLIAADSACVRHADPTGSTPLHRATGCIKLVEVLLGAGADPNARNDNGMTPLHLAIENTDGYDPDESLIRRLLDAGAASLIRDDNGQTPLGLAIERQRVGAIRLFLERGAAPDLESLLLLSRHDEALAFLRREPTALSRVRSRDNLLGTVLSASEASADWTLSMTRELLERGLTPTYWNLQQAVQAKQLAVARLLLERGVDPNAQVDHSEYLLPDQTTDAEMLALLAEFGARSGQDAEAMARRAAPEVPFVVVEEPPEDQLPADGYVERARQWVATGQYERALDDLAAALRLEPGSPEALNGRAWILATCPDDRFRNGDEAVTLARRVVRLAGNRLYMSMDGGEVELFFRTDYHNTFAAALAETGDLEAALQHLVGAEVMCRREEYRVMLERLRLCFRDGRAYRDFPPADEQRLQGQRLAAQTPRVDLARIFIPVSEPDRAIRLNHGHATVPAGRVDLLRVEELLAMPGLDAIESLTIEGGVFDAASAQRLAEGLRCPRLTTVDFSRSDLNDEWGPILLALASWPTVQTLKLYETKLGNLGLATLVGATWPEQLTHLDLGFNRLRVDGLRALAAAPWLAHLRTLECWSNRIRTEGLCLLAASPHLSALTKLTLGGNRLAAPAGVALGSATTLGELEELDLRSNRLGNGGAIGLGRATSLRPKRLYLATNRIGVHGITGLVSGRLLERTNELELKQNPLGREGTRVLANGRTLASLRQLDLSSTGLDAEAARYLADAPGLEKLQRLIVDEQEVGDVGAERLVDRFEDRVVIQRSPYYARRGLEDLE